MVRKLALGLCIALLMILDSDASLNPVFNPKQRYKNFNGLIIKPHDPKSPNKLCYRALNQSASTYWVTSPHEQICSNYIRCSNQPYEDLILDVKPEYGVVCDSHGHSVCIEEACEYLIPIYDEEKSLKNQRFKDYHGPVIDVDSKSHPTELCKQYFNDGEAYWRNRDFDGSCSSDILCYKPKYEHVDVLFNIKPQNGVLVNERTICLNGKRKKMQPYGAHVADNKGKDHGKSAKTAHHEH